MKDQFSLFNEQRSITSLEEVESSRPLAFRARPSSLDEFFGQEKIFIRYPFLKNQQFPALILWGPTGTGKTTLAHILAKESGKEFFKFNAVLGGVADLKKLIKEALLIKNQDQKESLIFIDEIHRFNKAQQDALLPYVEAGDFTLIGATTENPRSSVNKALLSRVQIISLSKLDEAGIHQILKRSADLFKIPIDEEGLLLIADYANGDARNALNILELVEKHSIQDPDNLFSSKEIRPIILENSRDYDRNQNRHYDVISAFIKSMRGSDPDSAILWLAVMLDGGEDPVFIARRLVVFASEDIGNADPQALTLAVSTLSAVSMVGMPEARINLAQAVTYLSSTVKSNASYIAINEALSYVENNQTIDVPNHIKNYPPKFTKEKYIYPHGKPSNFIDQNYSIKNLPQFYRPTNMGTECKIKARLDELWSRS